MHTSRICSISLVLMTLVVALPPSTTADDDVTGRFSVHGKLELTADALRESLTLINPEHEFMLTLPFSDTWKFETTSRQPLGASDERLTLDVRPRKFDEGDPWSQLDEYLDELTESRADVRFSQIVEEDDRHVACFQVRTSETAPWRWFYWTVIASEGAWLQLTLIDLDTQELESYDIDLVGHLASFTMVEFVDPDDAGIPSR